MAEKPRVKAPRQRTAAASDDARRKRLLAIGGGLLAGAAAVALLVALTATGGGEVDEQSVRADLEAAGCTLQSVKAEPGQHSLPADGTAKWNTDPPTNGPHFGFNADGTVGTVIWGAYDEPVQLARVVHNLEHGGVYIFYGDTVSDAVVGQLQGFYDDHKNGTVLAPYPKLGARIALGAWVAGSKGAKGQLAKCKTFDAKAFSSFFSAFQFRGPEPFRSSDLLPGGT